MSTILSLEVLMAVRLTAFIADFDHNVVTMILVCGFLRLHHSFWCWNENIPWELGQYHGCLMSRLLVSPTPLQPEYWISRANRFLSFTREDFNHRCCLGVYSVVPVWHGKFSNKYQQKTSHSLPVRWGMGCLWWIQHLIDILPQFLQLLM